MKQLATLLVTFGLVSSALGQALPDNPEPVPMPDPAWNRLQSLVYGQPIVVDNTNGPPVHCLFVGVTDTYLFCNPPGNPPGAGFRIDHASVLSVAMDAPFQPAAQTTRPERNYHPAWISSMIAGGIIVGLVATRSTDAGKATEDGFIGAGIVGLIGAPLAFLSHSQIARPGPVYPQYGIGLRLKNPIHSRARSIFVVSPSH